jgi:hypothetical protein
MALALALALIAVLTGCGQARKAAPHVNRAAVTQDRMEARLRAHGYTISPYTGMPGGGPYERSFSVFGIDWTSPASFSVNVYIFDSAEKAQANRTRTAALTGHFPGGNKSRLVGADLFVATLVGGGGSQCTMTNGTVHCPPAPNISDRDFEKVVAVAQAR